MNLTDIKISQPSQTFMNNVKSACGIQVDLSKLDIDDARRALVSINNSIKEDRTGAERYNLHESKTYMAKLLIKEALERFIKEDADTYKKARSHKVRKLSASEATALRKLVGSNKMYMANYAMSEALNHRSIPQSLVKNIRPIFEMVYDMLKAGPGIVDIVKSIVHRHASISEGTKEVKQILQEGNLNRAQARALTETFAVVAKKDKMLVNDINSFLKAIKKIDEGKDISFTKAQVRGLDSVLSILGEMGSVANTTKRKTVKKNKVIKEGYEEQAELLLATRDIVSRVQEVMEDLAKIRNTDIPPLIDSIRDELNPGVADAYSNVAIPALESLLQSAQETREILNEASQIITGESDGEIELGGDEEGGAAATDMGIDTDSIFGGDEEEEDFDDTDVEGDDDEDTLDLQER